MKYSDRPNTYINAKDLEIAIVKATSYGDALDAVRDAPSIDIIRCRECKYARNIEGEWICEHLSGMVGLNVLVKADDFCSYGSRSEKPNNLSEIPTGSDDTQTYITEDRDTRILDAWQVKHAQSGKE